jgi:hypothetical protein
VIAARSCRPTPHAKDAPADIARYAQSFDQLGLDSEHTTTRCGRSIVLTPVQAPNAND